MNYCCYYYYENYVDEYESGIDLLFLKSSD